MCRLLLCVLYVCLLSVSVKTDDVSRPCIFGPRSSGCMFPCHCEGGSEGGCDSQTGVCSSGYCVRYGGVSVEEHFYPWYLPGCQLGNILLNETVYIKHKETGDVLSTVSISSPYGTTNPNLCLFPYDPVCITKKEFQFELGQTSFIQILTILSNHEQEWLFMSVKNKKCKMQAKVTNAEQNSFTDCIFKLIAPEEPLSAVCNAVGKYIVMTTDCDLKENNVSSLCLNEFTVFGSPYVNINCDRCQKNYTNVAMKSSNIYANRVLKQRANDSAVLTGLSDGWNCGNGIWCGQCVAGYYPPDCSKTCGKGYYGQDCVHKCRDVPVPSEYHCKGNQTNLCDPISGKLTRCSEGCETWYTGSDRLCNFDIRTISWTGYDVKSERVGSDWVLISFKTPNSISEDMAGYYSHYIEYREVGKTKWKVHQGIKHDSNKCQLSVKVTGLKPHRKYDLRMRLSREHQGHTHLSKVNETSLISVITSCMNVPEVTCKSQYYHVTWEPHLISPKCGLVIVTNVLQQILGDEDWKIYDVLDGEQQLQINKTEPGIIRTKLLGYIENSDTMEVESDTIQCEVTDFVNDFLTWKFNWTTFLAIIGALMSNLLVGFVCYSHGKGHSGNNGNIGTGMKLVYLKDDQELPSPRDMVHGYTLTPGSRQQISETPQPTAGKATKTFNRKPGGSNTLTAKTATAAAETSKPAPQPLDNNLYCEANVQPETGARFLS